MLNFFLTEPMKRKIYSQYLPELGVVHDITGTGLPVALQNNCTLEPCSIDTSFGTVKNDGATENIEITSQKKIQEVFHVYLNKFENAVTHLFLFILGNT